LLNPEEPQTWEQALYDLLLPKDDEYKPKAVFGIFWSVKKPNIHVGVILRSKIKDKEEWRIHDPKFNDPISIESDPAKFTAFCNKLPNCSIYRLVEDDKTPSPKKKKKGDSVIQSVTRWKQIMDARYKDQTKKIDQIIGSPIYDPVTHT